MSLRAEMVADLRAIIDEDPMTLVWRSLPIKCARTVLTLDDKLPDEGGGIHRSATTAIILPVDDMPPGYTQSDPVTLDGRKFWINSVTPDQLNVGAEIALTDKAQ